MSEPAITLLAKLNELVEERRAKASDELVGERTSKAFDDLLEDQRRYHYGPWNVSGAERMLPLTNDDLRGFGFFDYAPDLYAPDQIDKERLPVSLQDTNAISERDVKFEFRDLRGKRLMDITYYSETVCGREGVSDFRAAMDSFKEGREFRPDRFYDAIEGTCSLWHARYLLLPMARFAVRERSDWIVSSPNVPLRTYAEKFLPIWRQFVVCLETALEPTRSDSSSGDGPSYTYNH